jgi:hypothetical protein
LDLNIRRFAAIPDDGIAAVLARGRCANANGSARSKNPGKLRLLEWNDRKVAATKA